MNNNQIVKLQSKKIEEILASCPIQSGGVHNWLWPAVHRFRELGINDRATLIGLLTEATAGYRRDIEQREIENAVDRSAPVAGNANRSSRTPKSKPDLKLIEKIGIEGEGVSGLARRSGPIPETAQDALRALFPGNPLICIGEDQKRVSVKPRAFWTGDAPLSAKNLAGHQFIVPSPMTRMTGLTKGANPRPSSRCLDNTGPRWYLIVECDFTDEELLGRLGAHVVSRKDLCASILLELAKVGPLAMIVDSGGKSLHGWFRVKDVPENKLQMFFQFATKLGADDATWKRCQLVRFPWGTRSDGSCQEVLYFDSREVVAR